MKTVSKTNLTFIITVAIIAICLFSAVSITFAKYINTHENDIVQSAENFYFESDFLTLVGETYQVNNNNTFMIEIMNFENVLKVTPSNTTFTISATGANISGGSPVGGVYTLTGGTANTTTLSITPIANTFTVSATTTAPYAKTISATFNVISSNSTYSISALSASNSIMTLTIIVGSIAPAINLEWDTDDFNYDNTNTHLQVNPQNGTLGSATLTGLQAGGTFTFLFFRNITPGATSAVASIEIVTSPTTIVLPEII